MAILRFNGPNSFLRRFYTHVGCLMKICHLYRRVNKLKVNEGFFGRITPINQQFKPF